MFSAKRSKRFLDDTIVEPPHPSAPTGAVGPPPPLWAVCAGALGFLLVTSALLVGGGLYLAQAALAAGGAALVGGG